MEFTETKLNNIKYKVENLILSSILRKFGFKNPR